MSARKISRGPRFLWHRSGKRLHHFKACKHLHQEQSFRSILYSKFKEHISWKRRGNFLLLFLCLEINIFYKLNSNILHMKRVQYSLPEIMYQCFLNVYFIKYKLGNVLNCKACYWVFEHCYNHLYIAVCKTYQVSVICITFYLYLRHNV